MTQSYYASMNLLTAETAFLDAMSRSSNPRPKEKLPEMKLYEGSARQQDVLSILSRHPGQKSATVIESLKLNQQKTLFSWAKSSQSELLWIDGCFDQRQSDWTTDLSLEIIGTAQTSISRSGLKTASVIYHFCDPKGCNAIRTPEIVVQDLLFQLIEGHDIFTPAICQKYHLTREHLREAYDCFDKLWEMFKRGIFVSKITSLVIVLDHVDSLFAEGQRIGKTKDFHSLLDNLLTVTRQDLIMMKVMVTMRRSEASDCLTAKSLDTSRHVILKVLSPPDRRRPTTKSRRKMRIPIEGRPYEAEYGVNDLEDTDDENGSLERQNVKVVFLSTTALDMEEDDTDNELEYSDDDEFDGLLIDSDPEDDAEDEIASQVNASSTSEARQGSSSTDQHSKEAHGQGSEDGLSNGEELNFSDTLDQELVDELGFSDSLDAGLIDSDEENSG